MARKFRLTSTRLTAGLAALALVGADPAKSQPAAAAFEVTGPHKVVMRQDPSLPNHTIYAPVDLRSLKPHSLPVVVWGNGACANAGNAFERYLAEIASRGFLVIANGPIEATPLGRPPAPGAAMPAVPAGGPPPPSSSVQQMLDAITWAQATGPYSTVIDAGRIAVAGQSCGGLQALVAAADPRVKTAVIMNSGVLRKLPVIPGAPANLVNVQSLPKPDLGKLHTPVIYIIGGPTDIAYENANGDFDEIKGVPVFRVDLDTGHNGTLWQPHGGRFADIASAWLQWRLKGDDDAAQQFAGDGCGLCRTSGLTVRTKNMTGVQH